MKLEIITKTGNLETIMQAIKRAMDISISLALFIILVPIMLLVCISIKLTSKGSVLFKQERIGRSGKSIFIYKFRTMYEGAENEMSGKYVTENDEMLTPLGKILRRWALDEIPQLFNVLRGDMSLVGPRPTLAYQVEKYNDRQRKRLLMKPGLTGWAQVNGRNKLTWPERIEYDIWYVENWSLWLDFKIILMTIPALLKKEYAFADENVLTDEIVKYDSF